MDGNLNAVGENMHKNYNYAAIEWLNDHDKFTNFNSEYIARYGEIPEEMEEPIRDYLSLVPVDGRWAIHHIKIIGYVKGIKKAPPQVIHESISEPEDKEFAMAKYMTKLMEISANE